jgi:bacteriocin-like protein
MKRNNSKINLENKKFENFAVLSENEMIKIKGGGKETPEPPVLK